MPAAAAARMWRMTHAHCLAHHELCDVHLPRLLVVHELVCLINDLSLGNSNRDKQQQQQQRPFTSSDTHRHRALYVLEAHAACLLKEQANASHTTCMQAEATTDSSLMLVPI
jgi:hypothetical protein